MVLAIKNCRPLLVDKRDTSSIPESGRSPRGWHGKWLQYSCLNNPMDRGYTELAMSEAIQHTCMESKDNRSKNKLKCIRGPQHTAEEKDTHLTEIKSGDTNLRGCFCSSIILLKFTADATGNEWYFPLILL